MFQLVDRNGVPSHILLIQAALTSLLALVMLLMPSVEGSSWLLTALTSQITCLLYVLIFADAIALRYSRPDAPRPFCVPGGKLGMWIVSGLGLIAVAFALFIGFVPPDDMQTGSPTFFVLFLLIGLLVLVAPPFILDRVKKPGWKPK